MPRTAPLLALAGIVALGLAIPRADAQTVQITGTYTGTDGAASGGTQTQLPDNTTYYGNNADQGYLAPNSDGSMFVFDNVTATGGVGGEVDGSDPANDYQGGDGGNGLLSQGGGTATGPQAIVNSGTYTGGVGGLATGTGHSLSGGYGGGGIDVNNSIAIINDGTFTGGDSGQASGSGSLGSGFAGSGLNSNFAATVTVNGGTFQGGNGAVVPGGGTGSSGDGIIVLGGTTSVYGGAFTGGTGNQDGFGLDFFDGTLTVYGTSFTVTDTANNTVTPNFNGAIPQGQGFITGTLANDSAPTTFTYRNLNFGGVFSLVDLAPAPEPSQWAAFAIGALSLSALAVRARKRQAI